MLDWIKEHPYLTGAAVLGIIVLYALFRSQSSAASSGAAAGSVVSTGPDDTIQAQEIAAGVALGQAQVQQNSTIATLNAQSDQAAIAAQVANLQTTAGAQVSQETTQAALTLGLAQNGNATQSILELLGAQPNASPFAQWALVSGVGPSTPGGGGVTTGSGAGAGSGGGSNPPPSPPGGAAGSGGGATPVSYPNVPGSGPVSIIHSDPGQLPNLYENNTQGVDTETQTTYNVNPQYYADPNAAATIGGILGVQEANLGPPGGVGATGGPFVDPNAIGFQVTAGAPTASGAGTVDAGQVISQLQNTPPGLWAGELGAYGISLTPAQENQLYQAFGTNQAVPETHGDSTQGETQGAIISAPSNLGAQLTTIVGAAA